MLEFNQPNQVTIWKTNSGSGPRHWKQNPDMIFVTKNGNQQMIKAPVTIASVFAAFFSRFSSNETCFFFSFCFFGFRFSFGVVNRALSSVWHPVLECLIGPFLQSVRRWLPGLHHSLHNKQLLRKIRISYLPVLWACVCFWNSLTLRCLLVRRNLK